MSKRVWKALAAIGLAEVTDDPPAEETEPEDKPNEGAPPSTAPRAPRPPLSKLAPKAVSADQATINAFDQSARKQLVTAMEAGGATLVEDLVDMLETLRENISDEPSLYKAAIKILVKQGNTVDAIRQDFDKCVGALETAKREFEAQLKGQLDKRVGAKRKAAADANQQIASLEQQLQQIQSQIATLAATAHEAEGSIADEQSKLQLAQERFTLAYDTIRSEIVANAAKVTQHGEKL